MCVQTFLKEQRCVGKESHGCSLPSPIQPHMDAPWAWNTSFSRGECCQTQVWLLVAQESNTEKQILAKRKHSFLRKLAILGRGWNQVPKNQLHNPRVKLLKNFRDIQAEAGGYVQNSTVNSGNHFEMGLWWSDQQHMDCSKYNSSLVPGFVCFHFL